MKYGQRLLHNGEWHAVANAPPSGDIWLISLEQKDALPFLFEVPSPMPTVPLIEGDLDLGDDDE